MAKKKDNTTSIGFEDAIWRAADKLPGRYVGIAEQEDDGEPFADKMNRLTSELGKLFNESHRLEEEIKKQLGSIGYKI